MSEGEQYSAWEEQEMHKESDAAEREALLAIKLAGYVAGITWGPEYNKAFDIAVMRYFPDLDLGLDSEAGLAWLDGYQKGAAHRNKTLETRTRVAAFDEGMGKFRWWRLRVSFEQAGHSRTYDSPYILKNATPMNVVETLHELADMIERNDRGMVSFLSRRYDNLY